MKKDRMFWGKALLLVSGGLLLAVALQVGSRYIPSGGVGQPGKISVFVSILPQKYFVERVGGDQVAVSVMVGPGQSPATYEPLPQQMSALATAQIYFRIGVPFETAWIDKLQTLNRELILVDLREGVPLRTMETPHHHPPAETTAGTVHSDHYHGGGLEDPHIWLDPLFVKIQAETIYRALAALDPSQRDYYQANLIAFQRELDQLHAELKQAFAGLKLKSIMVYHPAWGYLTDRYGLKQVAIEVEGKEPGPRELAQLIDYAKTEGIRVVFIQKQFNSAAAEAVARAVNGQVVAIDPLAEDYLTNMRRIARAIQGSHDQSGESD